MNNVPAVDSFYVLNLGMIVIGAVLAILGAFERYYFLSQAIDGLITRQSARFRPSAVEDRVKDALRFCCVSSVVLLILGFIPSILAADHSILVESFSLKFVIGIVLAVLLLCCLVSVALIVATMVAVLLVSFLGLCADVSNRVAGGRHLSVIGFILSAASIAQLFFQEEGSLRGLLWAGCTVILFTGLLETIRRYVKKPSGKLPTQSRELHIFGTIFFRSLFTLVLAVFCFTSGLHETLKVLWLHNEKVVWNETDHYSVPTPPGLTVRKVEFGYLTQGAFYRAELLPLLSIEQLPEPKFLAFAVRYDGKVDTMSAWFDIYYKSVDGTSEKIVTNGYGYHALVGWSTFGIPLRELGDITRFKSGHIVVRLGFAPYSEISSTANQASYFASVEIPIDSKGTPLGTLKPAKPIVSAELKPI